MITIPVVAFSQSDITIYVGKIGVCDLMKIGVIDSWDSDKGWDIQCQGYQRESYEKHYKAIGKFLRDNPFAVLPTSILLSARTSERGELTFRVICDAQDHALGYLEIPEPYEIYVVDGQHRLQGFMYAIKELGEERVQDFLLPIIVLNDVGKVEELAQFHLINDRQKRIPTNLALALLGTVVEDQPHIANMLVGPKNAWKMKAIMITIALNEGTESDNVWSGIISLPNEPKGTDIAIGLASFVNSLQPFYSGKYPHKLSNDQLRAYLITFWYALSQIVPLAFQSPRAYVIRRTTGVYSLNRVAAELARQKPDILGASWKDILQILKADGIHMIDYIWSTGEKLAKEYRGHSRFRDLADEILIEMGLQPSRPFKK